ncbi:uncharacterized protein [Aristolochia californica]|uniref:uncharacterized protein isoform X6 n=1 Tax=Aristolochia californica TaxID=171875 RepID=UPI0035E19C88
MLENPSDTVGRRNRALNRKKSGGWAVAMHAYNDTSIDQSERPAIYSGASSSAWGHSKLPHQFDFLAELRRSVRNANLSTTQGSADHS